MIHKGIENSEYWSYEGVTDLLTEIYWQVEEVMERHPEINDTQELVGKWMSSYTSQWLHLRTEGVTPHPIKS